MRLLTFIIFAGLLLTSSSIFAQNLTFVKKEVSLIHLFKEIKKQANFNVIWNEGKLDAEVTINADFRNASLEQVMTTALNGQGLTYTISEKTIIVTVKELSFAEKLVKLFSSIEVRGSVKGEDNLPLSGAMVNVKGRKKYTYTDSNGEFKLESIQPDAVLIISCLGHQPKVIKANEDLKDLKLTMISGELKEVEIVSNGYQSLPKERATGSFVQIDKAVVDRSVTTTILNRLDGISSGLIFASPEARKIGQGSIEIHGRSTLFGKAEPLVVLDNFPYDGDLNNINPNDVESITILKDAAAASAWGTRSGNGVIVITTKKGALNTAPRIGFNASVTIGNKPDLYYSPQLSSSEYIDVQQFLYNKGAYTTAINDGYSALSPAVEIFRNPSDPNYQSKLNILRNYDIRDQLSKYFYRPSINQQYQANIGGGSHNQRYYVSAGYDKNLASRVGDSYSRINLNFNNTYYYLKNKLELSTSIFFTNSKKKVLSPYYFLNPYDQVADANGNPIAVANTLRLSYAQTAGEGKLFNWLYKPLDELRNKYNTTETNLNDYRVNLSLTYKIINGLKASVLYSYEKGKSDVGLLHELESFYTRNLINKFTQIDPASGIVKYPLPMGNIYDNQIYSNQSHNGRFQLTEEKTWGKHAISMIAGTEVREFKVDFTSDLFYGYDRATGNNKNSDVNFTINYPHFYGNNSGTVMAGSRSGNSVDRFFSYYFNGAYTYAEKYIVSFSGRRDESNLFGVSTNQKGVPLWSAGLAWLIHKESFYDLSWLSSLKLRANYGFTGNANNSLSAYLTTETSGSVNPYNSPYSTITNPPNPSFRWEKIRNTNIGVDFSLKNNRLYGSIDLWQKKGLDLIGNSPIAPQTGVTVYLGNSANTLTKGLDVQLTHVNLLGVVKWSSTFLYNYVSGKVTDYKVSNGTNNNVVSSNYINPLQGYPYLAIFSYKYAGLNKNGDPQGYVNGTLSTDYSAIYNSTNRGDLVYNGSASPTSFGSLLNNIEYKNFNLSFNISYNMGYYFRRNSLDNATLNNGSYLQADYENRWQKPGDENHTSVPALIFPASNERSIIYRYSEALVEKADNIRLKDIRFVYNFPHRSGFPFKNLNLFAYASNVGILWRANSYHLDPDYPIGIPQVRTIALGIKTNL